MRRVLLAGVSTRAAAESAARAGLEVVAWDAFADADQHPHVAAHALPGRFTPAAVARAARRADVEAVAYLSPFENHPLVVGALASGRRLWGNSPSVLRRVRNPRLLMEVLARGGHATPGEVADRSIGNDRRRLLKPFRSGGGQRVRHAQGEEPVPRGFYLQPFVEGQPWSIAFVAAAGRAVPLGMSRQVIGDPRFGALGFRYCGSIVERCGDRLRDQAVALAGTVAAEFGLAGVNGIDFIDCGGTAVAIEVNPRWSSSMEVIERVTTVPVLGLHARACEAGELPPVASAVSVEMAMGKAIVFAKQDVTIDDNRSWLADPDVRDVPRAGQRIAKGHPVCSVFASGNDGQGCQAALAAKAASIYEQLESWMPPPRDAVGRRQRTTA